MQQDSQDLFLVNFNFNNEISDIKLNYYTWKDYSISIIG